jgi:hypothetical protein
MIIIMGLSIKIREVSGLLTFMLIYSLASYFSANCFSAKAKQTPNFYRVTIFSRITIKSFVLVVSARCAQMAPLFGLYSILAPLPNS